MTKIRKNFRLKGIEKVHGATVFLEPMEMNKIWLILGHEVRLTSFEQLNRVVIAKQNTQVLAAWTIDEIDVGFLVNFTLEFAYKTSLIFHAQPFDE